MVEEGYDGESKLRLPKRLIELENFLRKEGEEWEENWYAVEGGVLWKVVKG